MIKLSINEANALDMLAITMIKQKARLGVENELRLILSEIQEQIGKYKLDNVLSSKEYMDLYTINSELWDVISRIRHDEKIDAKIIDDANLLRFKFKKELQEKHFGEELMEKKELVCK